MASIIRIKRSSVSGNPGTLGAGELAYSALTDNGSNGGDRLYIGIGGETAGNAANHFVIGGKYFTDMMDHNRGTLTANSAILVDSDSKIDNLKVDNLDLNGNTISSTNANGDITLQPNGSGRVALYNPYIDQSGTLVTLTEYIQDVAGGGIVDSAEIDATYDDTAGTTSLDLKTTGVSAGSYGSATQIPTFTVDTKGRLTAAGTANVATTLSVAGDSGTDTVDLLSDTLTVSGGEGIDVAVTDNTITISGEDASTTNKGVASFATANFVVTSGAVSAKDITLGSSTLTLGSTTTNLAGLGTLGATGAVTFGSTLSVTGNTTVGGTLGVTGATTLSSTLGVAGDFAINTNKFTVASTSGNTSVAGTLGVTGNTTVGGTLGVTGNTSLSGTLAVTNDLTVNTNKFTVASSTGNTAVAGTLAVTGATTLSSTLGVTSNATIGGTLGVTGNSTLGGTLGVTGATTLSSTLEVTGTSSLHDDVDMNSNTITNLAEPVNDSDAATKYYVDNAVTGLTYKDAVNLLADSNVALTGSTSTLVIDSHAALDVTDNNLYRILLTGQTDATQNGIYTYTDNGTSYTLVRSDDADTYQELLGTSVFVMEGTVYANTGWVQSNHYLTDFDNQSWTQFSGAGAYTAGAGLTQSGTIFNVGAGLGITVNADDVALATSVAGAGLTYTNGVLDIVGTTNRITVNANNIDIASTYVGQNTITTLGTITTGTWTADVIADAYIANDLTISGGTINDTPIGQVTAAAGSFTTLTASSTLGVTGNTTVGGTLGVTGATTLSSTLGVTGNTTVGGTLGVTGATTLSSTLGVTGNVTVSANLSGAGAATSTLDGFNIDGGTY
jgi:fibronectin-binding autotransporter adhesin